MDNLVPRHLRLALIVDIMAPVPPTYYGGIERVVHLLAEGLVKRGHEVTLFASDDSSVPCRLIPFGHRRSQSPWVEFSNTARLFTHLLQHYGEFDIVHCLGRTLYLLPLLPLKIPKIQTYMCPLNQKKLRIAHTLSRNSLTFAACSQSVARGGDGIGRWVVIPIGVSLEKYHYRSASTKRGDPLLFLGRLHRCKGPHTAIKVARASGKKLIIAGTVAPQGPELEFFKKEVEPEIDGRQIQYIGPVNEYQKNVLLSEAGGFLCPIEWEEPMALIVLEALASGLPVIAFNRGSTPEVLTHGKDGFICSSVEEMIAAVARLPEIDRAECRRTVEKRFSSEVVVSEYERLYFELQSKKAKSCAGPLPISSQRGGGCGKGNP